MRSIVEGQQLQMASVHNKARLQRMAKHESRRGQVGGDSKVDGRMPCTYCHNLPHQIKEKAACRVGPFNCRLRECEVNCEVAVGIKRKMGKVTYPLLHRVRKKQHKKEKAGEYPALTVSVAVSVAALKAVILTP